MSDDDFDLDFLMGAGGGNDDGDPALGVVVGIVVVGLVILILCCGCAGPDRREPVDRDFLEAMRVLEK